MAKDYQNWRKLRESQWILAIFVMAKLESSILQHAVSAKNRNFNTHRMTVIISDFLVYLRGLESPFEFLNDCEVGVVSIYVKYQHNK